MNKFIIVIFTFILITHNLSAEIIKNINIEGNKRVSNETITLYGEIELNKDYSEKDIDKILKNLYSTNFFEDVEVSITNNTLNIKLKEYPVINQLVIVGEKSNKYKDQIRKIIKSKAKKSFIKSNLARDIDLIKDLASGVVISSALHKKKTKIKNLKTYINKSVK